MSCWFKYGATLLGQWVLFFSASLTFSSSCGIRGAHSSINFDSPPKTIPAPCGISQPYSVAELKGQQISTSTVFMLSGTETPCQLREFIWCHRDFFSPPIANLYIYRGEGGSSANMGDCYEFFLQLFCCCLKSTCRDGVKWKHVILYLSVTQRCSPNSLEVNNARRSINVNDNRRLGAELFCGAKLPSSKKIQKDVLLI